MFAILIRTAPHCVSTRFPSARQYLTLLFAAPHAQRGGLRKHQLHPGGRHPLALHSTVSNAPGRFFFICTGTLNTSSAPSASSRSIAYASTCGFKSSRLASSTAMRSVSMLRRSLLRAPSPMVSRSKIRMLGESRACQRRIPLSRSSLPGMRANRARKRLHNGRAGWRYQLHAAGPMNKLARRAATSPSPEPEPATCRARTSPCLRRH